MKAVIMSQYNSGRDIKKMIDKYVAGTATDEEIEFVESYYAYLDRNKELQQSATEQEALRAAIFKNITRQTANPSRKTISIKRYKYTAAAAVLLISLTTGYLFLNQHQKAGAPTGHQLAAIVPGSNKAILTLDDGQKVVLDDKANSNIKNRHGLTIIKTNKGQLVYQVSGAQTNSSLTAFNTVTTSRGGQYQIVLPDGTKVWLNAASSLTYPVMFSGDKRIVKLSGEGYFEVAKNKAMPFHVETAIQDVEVTGTHFDVNGYQDEGAIKTTLLEGSVNVHSMGKLKKIVPGEQALVFANAAAIEVKNVDTDEETAWKNGLFQFNNSSLKSILSQLERWYDIKVDNTNLPFKHYNGMVPRSANLSEVLKMLELTGDIKFQIDQNRTLKVIGK